MTNKCLDCGAPCKSIAKRCITCGNRRSMYSRERGEYKPRGTPKTCSECQSEFLARNPSSEICSPKCQILRRNRIQNEKWQRREKK